MVNRPGVAKTAGRRPVKIPCLVDAPVSRSGDLVVSSYRHSAPGQVRLDAMGGGAVGLSGEKGVQSSIGRPIVAPVHSLLRGARQLRRSRLQRR